MKLKLTTDKLQIGDRFKLKDDVTRVWNVYEITSDIKPITTNPYFSHWVECECKAIDVTPHPSDCQCGDCAEDTNGHRFDRMMWIGGEEVTIERK